MDEKEARGGPFRNMFICTFLKDKLHLRQSCKNLIFQNISVAAIRTSKLSSSEDELFRINCRHDKSYFSSCQPPFREKTRHNVSSSRPNRTSRSWAPCLLPNWTTADLGITFWATSGLLLFYKWTFLSSFMTKFAFFDLFIDFHLFTTLTIYYCNKNGWWFAIFWPGISVV